MKRASLLTTTAATCLLATNAFAGGAVDKITGEYTRGNCPGFTCVPPGDALGFISHRIISAHESSDSKPQKGFLLSWTDGGNWWEMDFSDTDNTCVKVDADGARAGGLISAGNVTAVDRYFGMKFEDKGEPAYFTDRAVTVRMSTIEAGEPGWEDVRAYFMNWCETGQSPNPKPLNYVEWDGIIFEGNVKVHNSPNDGD